MTDQPAPQPPTPPAGADAATAPGTCPRCATVNAPGARFCVGCGAPLGAAPPPPPPGPGAPQSMGGTQGFLGQDQAQAYSTVERMLMAEGAEIDWRQPPTSIRFRRNAVGYFAMMGQTLKYSGEASISRLGAQQSNVRVNVKPNWGSAIMVLLIPALPGLLSFFAPVMIYGMNIGMAGFVIVTSLVATIATGWQVASAIPEKMSKTMLSRLGADGAQAKPQAAPQPSAPAAPQPQSPIQSAAAATPPSAADDALARLKRFAELRDAGVISQEEFDAKKAELLRNL